jgi:ketosteroid isomerase-like protein
LRQEAQSRIDDLRWQAARTANDPAVIERYLAQNPNSRYVAQAQARIQELRPPPTAPVTKAAPPPAAEPGPSEADAIRDVLRRYGEAYRARDAAQVSALWPTLTADQVRRIADSFRIAVSIEQDLVPLAEPDVRGNEATVRCRRLIRYEDERGPQRPVDEQVTVTLRKQQGAWLIQAVN